MNFTEEQKALICEWIDKLAFKLYGNYKPRTISEFKVLHDLLPNPKVEKSDYKSKNGEFALKYELEPTFRLQMKLDKLQEEINQLKKNY